MLKTIFSISLVGAFFSLSANACCFKELHIDFLYKENQGYIAEIKADGNQPKTLSINEKDDNPIKISEEIIACPNEQRAGTYDLFLTGDKNSIPFCSINLWTGNVTTLSETSSLSDQSMILVNGQPWLYGMDANNADPKKQKSGNQFQKPKTFAQTGGKQLRDAVTPAANPPQNPYRSTAVNKVGVTEKSTHRDLNINNILLKSLPEMPYFEPSDKHFTFFVDNNRIAYPGIQGNQSLPPFQYTPISRADYEQIRLNSKEVITLPDGSIDTAFEIPNGGGGLNSCFFMSVVPYRFLQYIYKEKSIGGQQWGKDPARKFIMERIKYALSSNEKDDPKINEIKSWGLLAVKQGCDNKGKNENEHLGQKREFCTQALKYAIEQQNGMSSEMYPEYDILYSDCNRDIKLWDNPEIQKRWNEIHAVNAEILRTLYEKETADFCNKWSTSRVQLETDWNVPGFASIVGAIFNINIIIFANTNITRGGETLQKGTTLSTYYLPNASSTVCIGYHLGHYSKYVTISQIYTFLQEVAGDDSGNMPTFEDFSSYMLASGKLPDINEKTWITQLLADVVSKKPEPKAYSSKVVPMKSVPLQKKFTTSTMMNKVDMQNSEITTTPANPVTKEQEKKLIISKKTESKISLAETTPVKPVAPKPKLTTSTTMKKIDTQNFERTAIPSNPVTKEQEKKLITSKKPDSNTLSAKAVPTEPVAQQPKLATSTTSKKIGTQNLKKNPALSQSTAANKSGNQSLTLTKAQNMIQTLQKDLGFQIDPAELQMYLSSGGEDPFEKRIETTKWTEYIQNWYKRFRATVEELKENIRRNAVSADRNTVSATGSIDKNEASGDLDQAAQKQPVKRQAPQNTENKTSVSKPSSPKPNVANKRQVISKSALSTTANTDKDNSKQIGEVSKEQNHPAQKQPVIKRQVTQNTERKSLGRPISKPSSVNVANKRQVISKSTLSTKTTINKENPTPISKVSKGLDHPAQNQPIEQKAFQNADIEQPIISVNPYRSSNTFEGVGSASHSRPTNVDHKHSINLIENSQNKGTTGTPSALSSKSQLNQEELRKTQRENVIWTFNTYIAPHLKDIEVGDYLQFLDEGGVEPVFIDDKEYIVNDWYKNQYLKWKNKKIESTKNSSSNKQTPQRNTKK